jgi:hypothetical protein
MKEVKKVEAALRAVERWDKYLFRRALGVTFIVWAASVAVAGFVTLKAEQIASAIVVGKESLIGFTWLVTLSIALPVSGYFFVSAGRAVTRMKSVQRHERAGLAGIGIVWFVLMFTAGKIGEFIGYGTSWPLFIGIANLLTYAITKAMGKGYPEQLLVGVLLLAASSIVYVIGTDEIAYLSGLASIVVAYSMGGAYSLLTAARALVEEKQPSSQCRLVTEDEGILR